MSWQAIRGHDRVREGFARAVQGGRLAHGYLFTGPPGVGKQLFAFELAKTILCEGRAAGTFAACDQCTSCTLMAAGTHPDFFTVERPPDKNELPMELMQELCGSISLRSARGKGKVAVINNADDLNQESANCFLKTLEEPPPGSLFILVGTSPERQLATIVSRCQVVRFAPLTDALVAELLKQHGVEEPGQLARLARLAGGSPGQALALADPELWKFRRTLLDGLSKPQPDTVGLSRAFVEFVEEAGKESGVQRRRAALVLRLLIEFLDDALAVSVGKSPRIADDLPLLEAFARRFDPDGLLVMLERCLETEFHLDRYVQLVLALEALLDALGQQLAAA